LNTTIGTVAINYSKKDLDSILQSIFKLFAVSIPDLKKRATGNYFVKLIHRSINKVMVTFVAGQYVYFYDTINSPSCTVKVDINNSKIIDCSLSNTLLFEYKHYKYQLTFQSENIKLKFLNDIKEYLQPHPIIVPQFKPFQFGFAIKSLDANMWRDAKKFNNFIGNTITVLLKNNNDNFQILVDISRLVWNSLTNITIADINEVKLDIRINDKVFFGIYPKNIKYNYHPVVMKEFVFSILPTSYYEEYLLKERENYAYFETHPNEAAVKERIAIVPTCKETDEVFFYLEVMVDHVPITMLHPIYNTPFLSGFAKNFKFLLNMKIDHLDLSVIFEKAIINDLSHYPETIDPLECNENSPGKIKFEVENGFNLLVRIYDIQCPFSPVLNCLNLKLEIAGIKGQFYFQYMIERFIAYMVECKGFGYAPYSINDM
jgi:hypothetical protein